MAGPSQRPWRHALMQDTVSETVTFCNQASQTALPMRRWESSLPGTGVGGNPFEDPRARGYPTPPQTEPYGSAIFRRAATGLGYHPFPQPSCNLNQAYTHPQGLTLRPCMFCGFCERFGCEHCAKSSPQTTLLPALAKEPRFMLRTQCQVLRIVLDREGKRATGVVYADATGREFEQPAQLVIVGLFALSNVRMLLLSGSSPPAFVSQRRSVSSGPTATGPASSPTGTGIEQGAPLTGGGEGPGGAGTTQRPAAPPGGW